MRSGVSPDGETQGCGAGDEAMLVRINNSPPCQSVPAFSVSLRLVVKTVCI